MKASIVRFVSLGFLLPAVQGFAADSPATATVEHAISMERIYENAASDSSVVAVSPDGKRYATVTWHGDLARNTNVYSLRVGELDRPGTPPRVVTTRDFIGDPRDQHASPITDIQFLGDNQTVAFLGRENGGPAQVYTVNADTGQLHQLTHHPAPVKSFVIDAGGQLRVFSATYIPESANAGKDKLESDGVFLWDSSVFSWHPRYISAASVTNTSVMGEVRQYFLVQGGKTSVLYDSRQARSPNPPDAKRGEVLSGTLEQEIYISGWSSLTSDPQGRYALLFPYGEGTHPMNPERYAYFMTLNDYARRVAAPYGLVDLQTGKIERLLDAAHPQFPVREAHGGGPPVWSADGKSVIIYSVLPLTADSPKSDAAEMPMWLEVGVASRRFARLPIPPHWRVLRWEGDGRALVLSEGEKFGRLARRADGSWAPFKEIGAVSGLASRDFPVATNGRAVIGVKMGLTTPPELVSHDLDSSKTTALTDLNPSLRQLRYGAIETLRWADKKNPDNTAFVIRPVGYEAGKRYPLVILLDDGTLGREGEPYILDGVRQLSGHAAQMLAAQGFVVAYTREPRSLHESIETMAEGEDMCDFAETLVAKLDSMGLIDPARIGVSGWSRAGYHTDYLLIHSKLHFAAATTVDGGGSEYNAGNRPFTDAELQRIHTPLLIEPHGLSSMVLLGNLADRLDALGQPAELLYFATASHSTKRPQHRYRSLSTHIDWWKFWLQGIEDSSPAKAEQYARWRELKKAP